ncbi:MAG: hypothetical protein GYA62_13340 [Bacteroidales bacterium]|nr:hypothetical protein [Bacteroidales bacterium]
MKVSRADSLFGFLNFFSLVKGPDGFGMYRPLSTQVFYFLSNQFFEKSPLPLHLIAFLFFFGIIYVLYRFVYELTKSKEISLTSTFLYAFSATHFGQLYYLAVFQELAMTLFVLLSCFNFLKNKKLLSFIFFVLALVSKETAVITPLLFGLIYFYQKYDGNKVVSFKKFLFNLVPFVTTLFIYLLIRVKSYGFATGDSYIWDFSVKKFLNTTIWYSLWSINIPESLVDFIGPGININKNIFVYWGNQIIQILVLIFLQFILFAYSIVKSRKSENIKLALFCFAWFVVSLLPVVFLPLHKFSFYLTLPLIGIVVYLAQKLNRINKILNIVFCSLWLVTSTLTLRFTYETNWISQSQIISEKINNYFKNNYEILRDKKIIFVDSKDDMTLPWSPTGVVRTVLSDKNYFLVFYPDIADSVSYSNGVEKSQNDKVFINSRQFLGY